MHSLVVEEAIEVNTRENHVSVPISTPGRRKASAEKEDVEKLNDPPLPVAKKPTINFKFAEGELVFTKIVATSRSEENILIPAHVRRRTYNTGRKLKEYQLTFLDEAMWEEEWKAMQDANPDWAKSKGRKGTPDVTWVHVDADSSTYREFNHSHSEVMVFSFDEAQAAANKRTCVRSIVEHVKKRGRDKGKTVVQRVAEPVDITNSDEEKDDDGCDVTGDDDDRNEEGNENGNDEEEKEAGEEA